MPKNHRFATSLLVGVSGLAVATGAFAQTPAPESEVEAVVVTGSRIVQNGNNMPTPVTVVSTDQLTSTIPSNVAEGVQSLPVFSGAQDGPQRQPGNSSGNGAAHTLNLRSIGNTRTLVLYDGRRVIPTSPAGEVNIDIIPQMLLQRVDIVTGGASAVYGSDAVAGVVNFVTDTNFKGWKFEAMHGRSQLNDGEETKIGAAGGWQVNDRLHIMGSAEYYNSPGIFYKQKRKWGSEVWSMQGAGTTANPYRLVKDTRLNATSFTGRITNNAANGPLRDTVFRTNGVISPFQHGAATGSATVESGGDGGYFYNASQLSAFENKQLYGRVDFAVTDNVNLYVNATQTWAFNQNGHESNEVRNLWMGAQNAFLAPQYQAQLAAANVTRFQFSKIMQQAPVKRPDTHVDSYMVNFGLEGDLNGWQWDIGGILSKSEQDTKNLDNPNNGKLFAAMDAVRDPNGNIVCNVTLTNPTLYPGCVPINMFGPTSESAAAIDYVLDETRFIAKTGMDVVSGSITGSPFSTWAGPVGVAFSAEARKLTYELTSNAQPLPLDCTGLRWGNCTQGTTLRFQSNVRGDRTPVSQSVKEAAAEAQVPLLADHQFAQSFIINGAARWTDYSNSGTVWTWKLGADWDVNDQIKVRATRSRDIRAPNLNELYAPRLINPAGVTDLLTGIVGQAPFITDANPNLVPEVAKTWTAGVVLRPNFIPRFSVAVDWYKIQLNNAITNIQGQNPSIQNLCYNSGGSSPFCALIQRPFPVSNRTPANFVTAFYSSPQNAQVLQTSGVDVEANWATDLYDGTLSLRGLASYQPTRETIQFTGAPQNEAAGGPGSSKLRIVAYVKYSRGPFTVDIQQRWRSKQWYNEDRSAVYAEKGMPADTWTNMTVTYKASDAMSYYVTVRNLFDNQPTPYGNIGGSSGVPGLFGGYPPGDDHIGRYFNIGVKIRG